MNPAIKSLVPFAHVKSVDASIAFYRKLGFELADDFVPPGSSERSWAWLESGDARLMVARAQEPVVASQQGVLVYMYCDDVPRTHAALAAAGIAVGPIEQRFYAPDGEFRVQDPDGYVSMIIHR